MDYYKIFLVKSQTFFLIKAENIQVKFGKSGVGPAVKPLMTQYRAINGKIYHFYPFFSFSAVILLTLMGQYDTIKSKIWLKIKEKTGKGGKAYGT